MQFHWRNISLENFNGCLLSIYNSSHILAPQKKQKIILKTIIVIIETIWCIMIIETVYGSEATNVKVLLHKNDLSLKSQDRDLG